MPNLNDQTQKLLEENLALTKEVYRLTKKVNTYMISVQVIGIIKIILILAPIIFAVIYLPPFFKQAFSGYTDTLDLNTSQFSNIFSGKQDSTDQ